MSVVETCTLWYFEENIVEPVELKPSRHYLSTILGVVIDVKNGLLLCKLIHASQICMSRLSQIDSLLGNRSDIGVQLQSVSEFK